MIADAVAEPISLRRLIAWGLAASVVLLVLFSLVGGFGALAFGAIAALWSLAVAWIIVFGPPSAATLPDRRDLLHHTRSALGGWAPATRDSGSHPMSHPRGTSSGPAVPPRRAVRRTALRAVSLGQGALARAAFLGRASVTRARLARGKIPTAEDTRRAEDAHGLPLRPRPTAVPSGNRAER
ncbi:hypothetical protein [Frankia sp. AiPa1]|uniref:hypothetical protein n=1 Tax=Frankia sp. AiPa1 TaxID=573492 RepID=UPI00202AFC7C|nr:hypothetical protein [Frankia sp. AiPa1]MCL9762002.1 hypothetical protein [Frankia sp. AiPa1]